jgi:hypothetical protein
MKTIVKITLPLIYAIAVQFSFAQPVLTNSINLSIGDTYRYDGYEYVTNIDPGPSGENQIWDFANVTGGMVLTGDTQVCVDPSSTPYADSAAVINADICAVGVGSSGTDYMFFVNNSTSQIVTALANMPQDNDTSYSDIIDGITEFEFPFTYTDSYDYSYELQGFNVTQNYYFMHDSSTVSVEADAYGTVITPAGTWEDALRLKKTQHQYLWMRMSPGGDWLFLGDNVEIEYRWMAPGIKRPVMYVAVYEGSDEYTVHYLVEYNFTSGTYENTENTITIFPNPVTDRLTIESPDVFNSIRLFSVNGRQMKEFNLINPVNRQTLDFGNYPKGAYLIEVGFDNGSVFTRKIIK